MLLYCSVIANTHAVADALMCADITNYYDENSILLHILLVCVSEMYDEQGGSRLYVKLGKLGPGIAGGPRLPYSLLYCPPLAEG